jgi:hypothetical protein
VISVQSRAMWVSVRAMFRRQDRTGLVGVAGTALLGVAAQPSGACGTPRAQRLQPLLLDGPGSALPPAGIQILRSRLATAHATFHACRYNDPAEMLPDVDRHRPDQP